MDTRYSITNANVITLDPNNPIARSIEVGDGKIISINSREPGAKTIDLNGATVVPGLTDSHYHIKNTGKRLEMINLRGMGDLD